MKHYTRDAGWESIDLPDRYVRFTVLNASRDLRTRVGVGYTSLDPSANEIYRWIWDAERGYVDLPERADLRGLPNCVSDDGRIVAGHGMMAVGGLPRRRAFAWIDGQVNDLLLDNDGIELSLPQQCSDNGIVFGTDQTVPDAAHPHTRQAWWWKSPGVSGYLGSGEYELLTGYFVYNVHHVSADGSLVVGSYRSSRPKLFSDGFVWTQATGMVSVARMLEDLDLNPPWSNADETDLSAAGTTSAGDRIVLAAQSWEQATMIRNEGAILHLQPKDHDW